MSPNEPRFIIRQGGKYGAINIAGDEVVEPQYEYLGEFREGLACFKRAGAFGFVDDGGCVVVEPRFTSARGAGPYFSDGTALVGESGKLYYIDRLGQRLLQTIFYSATDFSCGLAMVKRLGFDENYSVIKKRGEHVSDLLIFEVPDYPGWPQSWELFNCFVDVGGMLLIGGFNCRGNCLFRPQYPAMTEFFGGVAGFCKDENSGLFGLIDLNGHILQPPRYYQMSNFEEGLACAGAGSKRFGFINSCGDWVIEPTFQRTQPFSDGFACVTMNRKKGFINKKGEMVIEPRFDREASFKDGLAEVEFEKSRAYINKMGEVVWRTTTDDF